MNFINSTCPLLGCGPTSVHQGLENLAERTLALFVVLEQHALVRKVAPDDPKNNILRHLLEFVRD